MNKFKPTQDQIDAAQLVFLAMTLVAKIKPIVEKYRKEILEKHQFRIAKKYVALGLEDQTILDPKDAFQLEDPDFLTYHVECKQARDAAKLHVDDEEFCPLLVAEHDVTKAEHVLIEAMTPATNVKLDQLFNHGIDDYKKYIELTLKLLAPFVGNSQAIFPKYGIMN